MILPIVAYGHPVLKQKAENIDIHDPKWRIFVENMFETMYRASGVGLAAPQVEQSVRIFVIDPAPFAEWKELDEKERETLLNSKKVFINARKLEEKGREVSFEEGCLSIPGIHEKVKRPESITLEYYDLEGNKHIETFEGILARVIQHEYDHIEGILFTDLLSPLKKKLITKKLQKISRGDIQVDYPMKFYGKKKP